MSKIRLTERQREIISLLPPSGSVADIGCDHGRLSVYLAESGYSVTATDISAPSLEKARVLSHNHNVDIPLLCGDGLSVLTSCPDCTIISGMGAETIFSMLAHPFAKQTLLIMQPMGGAELLRKYLFDHGFSIEGERIAREDRRFYEIISAKAGKMEEFNFSLPRFSVLKSEHTRAMLERQKRIAQKALESAVASTAVRAEINKQKIREQINALEAALKCV